MGTLRVCSFLAGMKGKPFGGFLFNHVPFFAGEVKFKQEFWRNARLVGGGIEIRIKIKIKIKIKIMNVKG
jgi:hypothetical protein